MPKLSKHTLSFWQHLRHRTIFLACSGGIDSMVLLHLLYRLKVDLRVIHVNYQLRGEDSERDAQFVQSTCKNLKIPCEIRTVDLKALLINGGNLQEEARKLRYSWFTEILFENSQNLIALGHHQDDQIETFLMNLSRKSGVLGLSCMKREHNGIVRPLLDFSRAEIAQYAINHNIEWREDQSNRSNAYTRNRLRNEFIPFLQSEFKDFSSSVLILVNQFQQKQSELEEKVAPIVQSVLETQRLAFTDFDPLDKFERIELLRQLDIPASYAERMNELTERGKKLIFAKAPFVSVVRDENHYTFLTRETPSYALVVEEVDSLPSEFHKFHAYLDASKIQGELKIRTWQIGDRISPIGMKGSQLISDIIKDAKINAVNKQNQLVVHDDVAILWCVGLKIGRNAIATSNSEKILRCSVIASTTEESDVQ